MKNKLINFIESKQIKKNIPFFKSGYIINVLIWVKEGKKKRLQSFEGIVIAKKNRGINSSFTVRKNSNGEYIERVFQKYSPIIFDIKIKNKIKKFKKSKLYYLRKYIKNVIKF